MYLHSGGTIVCLFHVAKVFFFSLPSLSVRVRGKLLQPCRHVPPNNLFIRLRAGGKDGTPLEASGDGTRFCTLQILINVLPLLLLLLSDSVRLHTCHPHAYTHYLPCTDPAVMVTLLRGLSAMHPQSHQVLQPLARCMSWTFLSPAEDVLVRSAEGG